MLSDDAKPINQLEQIIAAFDKIFFLPYLSEDTFLPYRKLRRKAYSFPNPQSGFAIAASGNFLQLASEISRIKNKKVLFIVSELHIPEYAAPFVKSISSEEAETLIRLYHTYEFADNFHMITDKTSFAPDIFNFVATGVLSYEEAWQALLS